MDGVTKFADRTAAMEAWKALPDSQLHTVKQTAATKTEPAGWTLVPRDADQVNKYASDAFADRAIGHAIRDVVDNQELQGVIDQLDSRAKVRLPRPANDEERRLQALHRTDLKGNHQFKVEFDPKQETYHIQDFGSGIMPNEADPPVRVLTISHHDMTSPHRLSGEQQAVLDAIMTGDAPNEGRLAAVKENVAKGELDIQKALASLDAVAPFVIPDAKLATQYAPTMHSTSLEGGYSGSIALILDDKRILRIGMEMGQKPSDDPAKRVEPDPSTVTKWGFSVMPHDQSVHQPISLSDDELTQLATLLEAKVVLCRTDPEGPIDTNAVKFAEGLAQAIRAKLASPATAE